MKTSSARNIARAVLLVITVVSWQRCAHGRRAAQRRVCRRQSGESKRPAEAAVWVGREADVTVAGAS